MKSRVLTAFLLLLTIALFPAIAARVHADTSWAVSAWVHDGWNGNALSGAWVEFHYPNSSQYEGWYTDVQGHIAFDSFTTTGSNVTYMARSDGYANATGSFLQIDGGATVTINMYPSGSSSGNWSLTSADGIWDEWNRTSWHVWNQNDQQYGNMTYQRFINDFQGYHTTINFTDFTMGKGAWWWLDSEKRFYFALQLQGSSNFCLRFWVRFSEGTNTWGILRDRMVWAGAYANFSDHSGVYYAGLEYENIFNQPVNAKGTYFDTWNGMSNYLDLYVWKGSNNTVKYQINMVKASESLPVRLVSGQFDNIPATWFNTVGVSEYFKHEGLGSIRGGMTDSFDTSGFNGEATDKRSIDFWSQLTHDFYSIASSVLPKWLTDYISQFASWGGYILGFLSIVWGIITSVAPYLPFILLFWLLDAALTSVNQGSFTPLGICIMTIYDWGTQLIHVLVAIGNAIYSFIKFW